MHPDVTSRDSLRSAFTIGRTTGILLLFQLATALMLPFILSSQVNLASPDFLPAVAEHSFQIRLSVFISFIGSALTVFLGITVFEILRLYSKSAAILFLVVCVISCILDLVHAGTIMSVLSISNEFVSPGAKDAGLYEVVGSSVKSARRSAHAIQLLAIGAWMFVFYFSILRFRLLPVALAVIGVIGVMLQFTGVTLMMFLGYNSIGEMAMPLLPIQITTAVWLIVKGFRTSGT